MTNLQILGALILAAAALAAATISALIKMMGVRIAIGMIAIAAGLTALMVVAAGLLTGVIQ